MPNQWKKTKPDYANCYLVVY